MIDDRRLLIARILAGLAVVWLPAFLWLGWWQLMVSAGLGVLAAWNASKATRHGPSGGYRLYQNLQRRLHPHSWRPGKRV